MNNLLSSRAVINDLKKKGYYEIKLHGPPGSGKTSRMRREYKDYDLIHIEQGINFERWLVRKKEI